MIYGGLLIHLQSPISLLWCTMAFYFVCFTSSMLDTVEVLSGGNTYTYKGNIHPRAKVPHYHKRFRNRLLPLRHIQDMCRPWRWITGIQDHLEIITDKWRLFKFCCQMWAPPSLQGLVKSWHHPSRLGKTIIPPYI